MMDSLNRWVEILRDKIPLRIDLQPNENETAENSGDQGNAQGPSVSPQASEIPESQVAPSDESDEDESEFSAERIWDLSELDPDLAENVFKPTVTESTSAGDPDDSDVSEMTPAGGDNATVIGSQSVSGAEDTEGDDVPNIQRVTVTEEQSVEDDESEEVGPVVKATTVEVETEEEPAEEDGEYQLSLEDDNSDGENDELFGGSVKVRPQVRKLLDTHGTIEAKDLLEELKSVANMMEKP